MVTIKTINAPSKFLEFIFDSSKFVTTYISYEDRINTVLESNSLNVKFIDNGFLFSDDEFVFESDYEYTLFIMKWS